VGDNAQRCLWGAFGEFGQGIIDASVNGLVVAVGVFGILIGD
jgi:hypothetical protein